MANRFIFESPEGRIDPTRPCFNYRFGQSFTGAISINDNPIDNHDEENLIWQGGYSAKSMFGAWLGAALVTALTVLAVMQIQPLRENRAAWATMILITCLIWAGLICIAVYRKLGRHYEITTQRLKHRSGILMRQVNRIEMIDVDDVSYRQGPIQALMNVGTIELLSSDSSHPKLAMPGISNVSRVASMIDDVRRSERRKHGIHVESI